jgi:hypothetical protein
VIIQQDLNEFHKSNERLAKVLAGVLKSNGIQAEMFSNFPTEFKVRVGVGAFKTVEALNKIGFVDHGMRNLSKDGRGSVNIESRLNVSETRLLVIANTKFPSFFGRSSVVEDVHREICGDNRRSLPKIHKDCATIISRIEGVHEVSERLLNSGAEVIYANAQSFDYMFTLVQNDIKYYIKIYNCSLYVSLIPTFGSPYV